jgi:hypothetical protein
MSDEQKQRRKPGRPPARAKMEGLHVTIAPDDLASLDAYCERHQIGRSEAIRLAIRKLSSDEDKP